MELLPKKLSKYTSKFVSFNVKKLNYTFNLSDLFKGVISIILPAVN